VSKREDVIQIVSFSDNFYAPTSGGETAKTIYRKFFSIYSLDILLSPRGTKKYN
jgi:hypothetical protein